MNQQQFEATRGATWANFEQELEDIRLAHAPPRARFAARYRAIARDLALARHRGYSGYMIGRLNDLARQGHEVLHRDAGRGFDVPKFLLETLPIAVRREWRLVALSGVLFYGPLLVLVFLIQSSPELVYSVLNPEQVTQYEMMYDPASPDRAFERGSGGDLYMFGFYIRNNIGIGFRTFGSGILAGIGPIFFMVYNGIAMGAVMGHLLAVGYGETLLSFVVGHGAFELNAIVLAGAAGMKVGFSLLAPGERTRRYALLSATREVMPIVYGFAGMLLIAAFIEAFWSSSQWIPVEVKYGVAAVFWTGLALYFGLVGRGRDAA